METDGNIEKSIYFELMTKGDVRQTLGRFASRFDDFWFGFQAQCLQANDYHHLSAYNADPDVHRDFEQVCNDNPITPHCLYAPMKEVFHSQKYLPKKEFLKTRFYNEFWRPRENGTDCYGLIVHRRGTEGAMLIGVAPERTSDERKNEMYRALDSLRAPFQTAFDLFLRMGTVEYRSAVSDFFIEQLHTPAFIVDNDMQIRLANTHGEAALRRGVPFSVDRRLRLNTGSAADRFKVSRALASSLKTDGPIGPVALASPGMGNSLAYFSPIPSEAFWPDFALPFVDKRQLVLVKLVDPEFSGRLGGELAIRTAFQLSAREAEIVGLLCKGKTLAEIAEQLDITYNTCRNHLASVMRKTGVRSQVELVVMASAHLAH